MWETYRSCFAVSVGSWANILSTMFRGTSPSVHSTGPISLEESQAPCTMVMCESMCENRHDTHVCFAHKHGQIGSGKPSQSLNSVHRVELATRIHMTMIRRSSRRYYDCVRDSLR